MCTLEIGTHHTLVQLPQAVRRLPRVQDLEDFDAVAVVHIPRELDPVACVLEHLWNDTAFISRGLPSVKHNCSIRRRSPQFLFPPKKADRNRTFRGILLSTFCEIPLQASKEIPIQMDPIPMGISFEA